MKIVHVEDYAKLRAQEYPSIEDQLDEIWKILDKMGVKSPILDKIKEIKAKFDKEIKGK